MFVASVGWVVRDQPVLVAAWVLLFGLIQRMGMGWQADPVEFFS